MLKYAQCMQSFTKFMSTSLDFILKRVLNTTMIKIVCHLWHGIIFTSYMSIKVHEVLFLSIQGSYQKILL